MATPGSAGDYRSYRRQRLHSRVIRWRKMWRIYYGSTYGKIGFWMLLGFAVITILSPLLTFHDPNYFIAPYEDSYAAQQELGTQLPYSAIANGTPLQPSATPISGDSDVLYTTASNGSVSAVGLGASGTTAKGVILPVLDPHWAAGSTVFPASVFALADYNVFASSFTTFDYSEFLLDGATHANASELEFAHIQWSGPNGPGDGTPSVADVENLTIPGTLVAPPVANSIPTAQIPSWGPFVESSAYTVDGLKAAYLYTVTHVGSGYNLTEFYAQPLEKVWSARLPGTALPGTPAFLGSYYAPPDGTEDTAILITQGATILSYAPGSGALRWESNLSGTISPTVGVVIPFDDELGTFSSQDVAFVATEGPANALVDVNLATGANQTVTTAPGVIRGVAASPGPGFPTYLCLVTSTTAYFLASPGATATASDAVTLPTGFGTYQTDPLYDVNSNLMIISASSGFSIAIIASLGSTPVQWRISPSPTPSAISAPLLVVDGSNGGNAVAFVTSGSVVDIYSTFGVDQNPLPPMLHTPSGNVYLFGTNVAGNDVWSQWVASFVWDWEIGLSVAAGIMLLSVLVAMFIGYVGSWAASIVETMTLVLFLLPGLALLIVVASIVGQNFLDTLAVLAFVGWPFTAITLIGVVRQIKARTFVEAARVSGAGTLQILRRHMLPNMTPLLAYFTAIAIGGAATLFSTLQFLGIAQLTIPTWGGMLEPVLNNEFFAIRAPWWIWPPTITLTMFVFAFIFVSRGLDEVVNPRIRPR